MSGSQARHLFAVAVAGLILCGPSLGAQPADAPAQGAPPPEIRSANTHVEVAPLGSPDGPAAGLLDSANGGMAPDIWSGSPRGAVEDLLARLPLTTPVKSIRSLARRLVLTKAEAPVGQAPHAFQTVRLRALLAAGLAADAAKLATQIPLKGDPEFAQVRTEAFLLGGQPADVCSDATAMRTSEPSVMWMQLRAYCYGAAGQGDLLELTHGVMKAQGIDDKTFETLLDDVLSHKTDAPGAMHDPTAVELFLLRQAGLPVDASFAAKFGMSASLLALRDAKNPPEMRAEAAGQAIHGGAVSFADLNAVADAQSFTPEQIQNAGTVAPGLPFFVGQALIRQAVAQAHDDGAKVKLLAQAFRLGRQAQLLPVAVGMQRTAAAALIPRPSDRACAGIFARAMMLGGHADAAERWRESLGANSDADKPLSALLAVELNLVAPNSGRFTRSQTGLAWLAANAVARQPEGNPALLREGALALAISHALGDPMPPGSQPALLLALSAPGRNLPPAVKNKLNDLRGAPGMKGEVLLMILDAVGAEGPGDLSPDTVVFLIRTLVAEGEGEAARAFAIDALLLAPPLP